MGKIASVPHRDGEAIKKEIYLISNFTTNGDLRIELYYNDADSAKSIMGVDRSIVIKSGAKSPTIWECHIFTRHPRTQAVL